MEGDYGTHANWEISTGLKKHRVTRLDSLRALLHLYWSDYHTVMMMVDAGWASTDLLHNYRVSE